MSTTSDDTRGFATGWVNPSSYYLGTADPNPPHPVTRSDIYDAAMIVRNDVSDLHREARELKVLIGWLIIFQFTTFFALILLAVTR